MKRVFLILLLAFFSCAEEKNYQEPDIDISEIQTDFLKWHDYDLENIDLSTSFKGLDTNSEEISKRKFLQELSTGDFFTTKMLTKDPHTYYYKLAKIENGSPISIGNTSAAQAEDEMRNYRLVEQEYPDFEYTDINGNTYSKAELKGKVIVFKFWFIYCIPCVKEIPEMNKLVEEYADENVIFLSLAWDEEDELRKFLSDREYNYKAISKTQDYISDTVKVKRYPTHMIVNENRMIINVVNDTEHLRKRLEDIFR